MKISEPKSERQAAHRARMNRRLASRITTVPSQFVKLSRALALAAAVGGIVIMVENYRNYVLPPPTVTVTVPELSSHAREGSMVFQMHCAGCHGENAAGTPNGPPLIHKLYAPSQHDDHLFRRVIATGVAAHHWQYGPMPAIRLSRAFHSDRIIKYIRELQRANGID